MINLPERISELTDVMYFRKRVEQSLKRLSDRETELKSEIKSAMEEDGVTQHTGHRTIVTILKNGTLTVTLK